MMTVFEHWTCDRCGSTTECRAGQTIVPVDWVRVWMGTGEQGSSKFLAHLCHNCKNALGDWLKQDGSPDP